MGMKRRAFGAAALLAAPVSCCSGRKKGSENAQGDLQPGFRAGRGRAALTIVVQRSVETGVGPEPLTDTHGHTHRHTPSRRSRQQVGGVPLQLMGTAKTVSCKSFRRTGLGLSKGSSSFQRSGLTEVPI